MKREYIGLKVEKIDFGAYNMVATGSLPSNCIQIVSNRVDPGDNVCQNPSDTTSYMYVGNNPYGD